MIIEETKNEGNTGESTGRASTAVYASSDKNPNSDWMVTTEKY